MLPPTKILTRYAVTAVLIFSSLQYAAAYKTQKSSPIQNVIIDILMQTISPTYKPKVSNDIFDILRYKYDTKGPSDLDDEYDYVIVGAGSAGCALAARLSEDKNIKVLLMEAGRGDSVLTDVPLLAPYFQRTEYAWPYYMEPQPNVCLGMINKRCYWPRGKAVGGTSVINYMIYTRGRPAEWDNIASDGNYGWSYSDVLPYYKKSESANLDGLENSEYRNKNGELSVEFVKFRSPLIEAFLEAGRTLGHPTVDYNHPEKLGFGYVQATTKNGKRHSSAKAFLLPNKDRPNLHISEQTFATKVLIDSKYKSAYGVSYFKNNKKYEVRAKREVILSAGPIASPHLLMLSGIGPKEQLKKHDVHVISDLKVGARLYDHLTFPGLVFTLNTSGVSINEGHLKTFKNLKRWFKHGDNALASPGAVEGIGYIKTHISEETLPIPDIELISIGGSILSDGGWTGSKSVRKGMRLNLKSFNKAFGRVDNTETWSVFPLLIHPKSVGHLELKNKDPFTHPLLYGNYLTDPRDAATFVASIRHIQKLAATPAFQKFGAKVYNAKHPTCKGIKFDTDDYWECAVRTLTATLHHQIATCRMGPESDSFAVVDPELRVYGVKKLRVVDSSVLPRTISVHTNAPAIMIGEKAADMIKNSW